MPPEEAGELAPMLKASQIDLIYLIAPTTDVERIKLINQRASGYLYYVSLKGVTGANTLDLGAVAQKLAEIRAISDLPVGVGFGIKDGATAQAVAAVADAVVVGSALVNQIAMSEHDLPQIKSRVSAILREMRSMMDVNSEHAA
jgi:tryptophan synthase alpha chain